MFKILLVEDDSEDQYLFYEAINTLALMVHCKTVTNGKEALNHLQHCFNYDLIFMDLNMPVMTGIECIEVLKTLEKQKEIPVIIISTSVNPAHKDRCKELGIEIYWHKPNTFPELCNGLYDIIKNRN